MLNIHVLKFRNFTLITSKLIFIGINNKHSKTERKNERVLNGHRDFFHVFRVAILYKLYINVTRFIILSLYQQDNSDMPILTQRANRYGQTDK